MNLKLSYPCGPKRRLAIGLLAQAALSCLPSLVIAQPGSTSPALNWPVKPIRLVVGYSAGGATDLIARQVGQRISEQLGQPVTIDNRTGANSNVGAEAVSHAAPDGYTLYVYTIANTINASLYPRLGYDPVKDFEPIGLMASIPNVLVVNPALPIKSLDDYQRFARENKDGITFASSGNGSSIHLSGEIFKMQSRLNLLHVPYRGSAPAISDLIGGQVQSMFDNMPSALPHIKAGRLRAIAVTSAQRSALLPEVPTLAESGYPGFEVQSWFGLAAPAGTPPAVLERLNQALNKVLAQAELRQRLQEMAATPLPGTAAQMRQTIASDIKRWREVVKVSGAKAD